MLAKLTVAALAATAAMTIAPHQATAIPVGNEGCQWSDTHNMFVYTRDGVPCRGTGEDPATNRFRQPVCADERSVRWVQRYGAMVPWCAR